MRVRIQDGEVTLTRETIDKTWQWYIDNARDCINEVLSGEVKVNNVKRYIDWNLDQIEMFQNRKCNIWLGFIQRAVYIQTGESIPLMGD